MYEETTALLPNIALITFCIEYVHLNEKIFLACLYLQKKLKVALKGNAIDIPLYHNILESFGCINKTDDIK